MIKDENTLRVSSIEDYLEAINADMEAQQEAEDAEIAGRWKEAIQTFDELMMRLYQDFATLETDTKANISRFPIMKLVGQGERQTVEFKETLEYDTKQKGKDKNVLLSSLKTIAGFLNAEGGTMLIGVDDSGKIRGIERDLKSMNRSNTDKFQLKIRDYLKERFEPQPIGKTKISFEKFNEGTICRVDVQKSKEIIHLDNEVYVRDGNTTRKLEGRELTDWIQQRKELMKS